MPNGYTRQDTTGALANGQPIDADLFNNAWICCIAVNEFDIF